MSLIEIGAWASLVLFVIGLVVAAAYGVMAIIDLITGKE
jgi:hypothetical protein